MIGEAAGLADGVGRTFLRQLLSEGKIQYLSVNSAKGGHKSNAVDPIEGPVGLIMTTTADALHPEDETRLLSVNIDRSPERIEAILMSKAQRGTSILAPIDEAPWHVLHDYIATGDHRVEIPFSAALAARLPCGPDRIVRDFPQVLSLIAAHALMHQCTRERDADDRVIAEIEDYRAVHALVAEPLSQGLKASIPAHVREVVEGVKRLTRRPCGPSDADTTLTDTVSQTQLASHLGRNQSVITRNVRTAIDDGYLIDHNPGQGRHSKLRLGNRDLPSGSVLPTPEELSASSGQRELVNAEAA